MNDDEFEEIVMHYYGGPGDIGSLVIHLSLFLARAQRVEFLSYVGITQNMIDRFRTTRAFAKKTDTLDN